VFKDVLGNRLTAEELRSVPQIKAAVIGEIAADGHIDSNKSKVSVTITPVASETIFLRTVRPEDPGHVDLNNAMKTVISGNGEAGTIKDNDNYHSADAFGAAALTGITSFFFTQSSPLFTAYTKNNGVLVGVGEISEDKKNPQPNTHLGGRDPIFMQVRDVTDGGAVTIATEVLAAQTIDLVNAFISLTDAGIDLKIPRFIPDASVSLNFETLSPWVINPYSYGATLSNAGFSAFGATPADDWIITETDSFIDAFFAFGSEGQPFDVIMARPPESLFQTGRMYDYGGGAGNGAFAWVQAPEPDSVMLVVAGLVALLAMLSQRRRSRHELTGARHACG
jgi:hypothetical protein